MAEHNVVSVSCFLFTYVYSWIQYSLQYLLYLFVSSICCLLCNITKKNRCDAKLFFKWIWQKYCIITITVNEIWRNIKIVLMYFSLNIALYLFCQKHIQSQMKQSMSNIFKLTKINISGWYNASKAESENQRRSRMLTLQWMTTTCRGSALSQLSMALQMVQILSRGGACRSGQPVSRVYKTLFIINIHTICLSFISIGNNSNLCRLDSRWNSAFWWIVCTNL